MSQLSGLLRIAQTTRIVFQKKIKEGRYQNVDQLEMDVVLLCDNAQTYNIEGSLVSRVTWSLSDQCGPL